MTPDDRLDRALRDLGSEHEPPAGWEARTLAAVEPRRSEWTNGHVVVLYLLLAAIFALAIAFDVHHRSRRPLVWRCFDADGRMLPTGADRRHSARCTFVPLEGP